MSSQSKDRAITPARTASHDRPAKRACDRSSPSRSPPRRHGDDEEQYRREREPSRSRSRSAERNYRRWWQRVHGEDYDDDDERPEGNEFTVRIDGHDDLFNCVICDGLLSSPVYECDAGHLACQRCYDLVEECRECGSTDYSPSAAVANLLRSIRFPCVNREYGCRAPFLPRHDMAVHERTCLHAPCFCPSRGCGFYCLTATMLETHLVVRRHGWRRHLIRYGEPLSLPAHEPSVLRAVDDEDRLFHLSSTQGRAGTALSMICIRPDSVAEAEFTYEVRSPGTTTADGSSSRPTRRLRMESTVWCTSLRHGMDDGDRISVTVPDDMLRTVEVCIRKVPPVQSK